MTKVAVKEAVAVKGMVIANLMADGGPAIAQLIIQSYRSDDNKYSGTIALCQNMFEETVFYVKGTRINNINGMGVWEETICPIINGNMYLTPIRIHIDKDNGKAIRGDIDYIDTCKMIDASTQKILNLEVDKFNKNIADPAYGIRCPLIFNDKRCVYEHRIEETWGE